MAKANILPLIIFILAGQVYADKNDVFLEGLEGVVRIDFSDGSVYKGQVDECLIELTKATCMAGMGVYDSIDGSKYFGSFKGNKPNGSGLFIHLDGQTYEGNFKDGAIHGKGIMTYSDGRRYEGGFKNNMRNGFGIMTYQDRGKYEEGSSYQGEWLDDERNGQGVMIYSNDGRRLKGEFKDNVFINYN